MLDLLRLGLPTSPTASIGVHYRDWMRDRPGRELTSEAAHSSGQPGRYPSFESRARRAVAYRLTNDCDDEGTQ